MTQDEAIEMIRAEVTKATRKFPTWPTDPIHAGNVLTEESGELAKAVLQAVYEPHKSTPADVQGEAIQTGAMAVRFLMSMSRYQFVGTDQHIQDDGPTRCKHCGRELANALGIGSTHCNPPFAVQPHDFTQGPTA